MRIIFHLNSIERATSRRLVSVIHEAVLGKLPQIYRPLISKVGIPPEKDLAIWGMLQYEIYAILSAAVTAPWLDQQLNSILGRILDEVQVDELRRVATYALHRNAGSINAISIDLASWARDRVDVHRLGWRELWFKGIGMIGSEMAFSILRDIAKDRNDICGQLALLGIDYFPSHGYVIDFLIECMNDHRLRIPAVRMLGDRGKEAIAGLGPLYEMFKAIRDSNRDEEYGSEIEESILLIESERGSPPRPQLGMECGC